jgi:hypothetical protein
MSAKRYFYVMTGLLALLFLFIIGGAVGGNMLLKKQSEKLTNLKVENKAVEMQQTALVQAKRDVEKYSSLEEITKSVVPQDKDQARTVREIVQIAADNNIPIKSITFESSTLGQGATPGAQPGAAKLPGGLSQVKPVQGITGVFSLPISVDSAQQVSYQDFLSFLEDLEQNRRTAHVESINVSPQPGGRSLNFSIKINAYVKP